MDNIQNLYKERNEYSKKLITDAFNGDSKKEVPYIINTANYFVFGEKPELIPDKYFKDPAVMYKRQIEQFERHFNTVEDNYVPYLMPFMGTGVLCSAFGCQVEFLDKMDPSATGFIINDIEDLDTLKKPDMKKDGLAPHVLKFLKYFKENSDIPVGVTDIQGPFTTALQVAGYDTLFYWMYDYPERVHELMQIITDALIDWIKIQKEVIGEAHNSCIGNQGIYVPDGIGIWLSDDDAILVNSELYAEFVVPYNDMICKAFGRGIVHYCGEANHQIENFNNMKYLAGINNFSLGDYNALNTLRNGLRKDLTIVACDFTPMDYEGYYKTLFEDVKISKQSIVFQSLFSPIAGLKNKKYEITNRDEKETVAKLDKIFKTYLR